MTNKFDIKELERGSLLAYMGFGALFGTILRGISVGIKTKEDFGIGFLGGMTAGALTRGILEIADSTDDYETEVKQIELLTDTEQLEVFDLPYGKKTSQRFVTVFEYGKTYKFKVKEYTICRPKDLNRIKWECTAYNNDNKDYTILLYANIDWTNRIFYLTIDDKNGSIL